MGASFPDKHWYRLTPLSLALWPVSLLYRALSALRRHAYRCGILRAARLPVPVVVVGNLVAGGTGKTPLALWLASALRNAGRRPGIVSRGYRGGAKVPMAVASDSPVDLVGDEPLLLARAGNCPVWIGRDRVAAARGLLAACADCDVLILDDGLQHYRVARDLEIAVEDERGSGNGLLMPAGPLREPRSRQVDAWVVNSVQPIDRPGAFRMELKGADFRRVAGNGDVVPAAELARLRLHAIAGIGNPQRFFDHLRRLGLNCVVHPFPDHHAYRASELEFEDCDALLMTQKDAVKCEKFARANWYALQVEAQLAPAFLDFVLMRLNGLKTA